MPTQSTPATDTWQNLLASYRMARAKLDMHCAHEPAVWTDIHERELNLLSDAHSAAINAVLLTPSPTARALAEKLEIVAREDIADGWCLAREIMALAALDADRLIREPA